MATLDDVDRLVAELPEVTTGTSYGNQAWSIGGKVFAWERPFSKADIKRFGDESPPEGPILGIRTEDLGDKEAVLAAHPKSCFTIPHFDGYSAVLVQLDVVAADELRQLLEDGWLVFAPDAVAKEYLSSD
ncbi:MmcQ/YjbR family DNA-binding protein [Rhodococcus sp. P1Y]|uniref:MmcQ/YjbR family DNA-binding protein n=1 Tax=Rhodococcus sp. P1Y TaxID=1302308 RepID=UPI000EB4D9DD|nr:MmcQ/YjbR family DNA-binding protein [Rhodococcus sp. P1Y]AYJ50103.1 hypothetical protein D8W71_19420 [Rhodococcus sp. P1Y]